jgi:hypothetical protein
LARMAHRVARGLVGGCALLLGVTLTGCGAPQYTYIANSSANTYFKVPYGWHKVDAPSLATVVREVMGSDADWQVAYEANSKSTARDFLSFGINQPFIFAETVTLTTAASQSLSYDGLRDYFLPVTTTAQSALAQEYAVQQKTDPFTNFKQFLDQVLTPSHGVHGVREVFEYTLAGGPTDVFDEIALTNADQTVLYFLVAHCTTACYSTNFTKINDVMKSFTIGSPT